MKFLSRWLLVSAALAVVFPAAAQFRISEFMASNTRTLMDEDRSYEDWIEIQNTTTNALSIAGWYLTDDSGKPKKWTFPATNVPAGGYLVVFASNKDRVASGRPLHTNFRLANSGEYLALVLPNGATRASEFSPAFPAQAPDVSYGLSMQTLKLPLLRSSAPARVLVPDPLTAATNWMQAGVDDSTWAAGTNGVGFDTGVADPGDAAFENRVLQLQPAGYWRFNETSGGIAVNLGSEGAVADLIYQGGAVAGVAGPRPPSFDAFAPDNAAVRFNGMDAFLAGPTGPLTSRSEFSLAGWINPASPPGARTALFGQNDVVEFGFMDASTLVLWTPVNSVQATYPYSTNEWHHVAVVGTPDRLQLFLDGALVAESVAPITDYGASEYDFNVGAAVWDATGNYFDGVLDEVALWTRALSTNEVASLMAPAAGSQVDFTPYLSANVQPSMLGQNASALVRIPFVVNDPASVSGLKLRVRYDDGFVAWLNGAEIARRNAPAMPEWNSAATARHTDTQAVLWEEFEASPALGFLTAGTNVLALQGLNIHATNSDFLVQAEIDGLSVTRSDNQYRYFVTATPGQPNGYGTADLGPVFLAVGHAPNLITQGQSLVVTAKVAQAFLAVTNVTLRFRVNFGADIPLAMNDGGTNGDAVAGDGVYTVTLPSAASGAGSMLRYFLQAADAAGNASRWPIVATAADSQLYLGTVVQPPGVESDLPLVQLFIQDTAAADTQSGARGSLFYRGELYDNVLFSLHGQSSAGWPKKSHNLDFPSDHRFQYADGSPRVKDIKLLSNYGDKARMRTTLAYEQIARAGSAAHFSFQVRVQQNLAFQGIFDLVEDADDLWLERLGRDPEGALYKMYNNLSTASGNEKKTRKSESSADLTTLITSLDEALPLATRVTYGWDNLDLPQVINFFVSLALVSDQDHGHKNYYMYCDSLGTGEWAIIPWDVDLSFGRNWLSSYGYFSDTLYLNNTLIFYPDTGQTKSPNRLYNLIFDHPDFRRMYLRRLRTVVDTLLLPGTTPPTAGSIEARVRQFEDLMDPPDIGTSDADLDRTKWGPTWGDANLSVMRADAERIINTYLPGRRQFILQDTNAHVRGERVPASQPTNTVILITTADFNPASGNQEEEHLRLANTNAFAVDVSGWRLDGGVTYTVRPGTVIPAGGALFLSPNVTAFRNRTTGPRRGQNLYVQGPYSGRLNAWGETLVLRDDTGRTNTTFAFAPAPSLAQRYLRITEIMYHPAPLAGSALAADEFEFIELRNISTSVTLSLAGVRFTNGIAFNFTGAAVTNLLPGQRVLLVRNPAAFQQRYGSGLPVAGQYLGSLENGGETLRLEDAVGEKILEFDYNNAWYPITDGHGFSLAIINDLALWDTWGQKNGWRPNGQLQGTPGAAEVVLPAIAPIVINEALTHTDPPLLDTIELFNPTTTNVPVAGWFLTDDFNLARKYRLPSGATIAAGGYLAFNAAQFSAAGQGTNAFNLSALGEEVWVFSGDAQTNLTGWFHGFKFGAAPNGAPFGRHVNSQTNEQFVLLSAFTQGASNAPPRVGPVVVSEFMYHPPDLAGGVDNAEAEFIELSNLTATNALLYDPAAASNTWRLRAAVDFDFPTNVTLAPGARLLVVGFDPQTNAVRLDGFRTLYAVPANVPVLGPWSGKLDNSSESIELKAPDSPNVTATNVDVPYYLVEQVNYHDGGAWPAGADGGGASLQRLALAGFGNDPTNWAADVPSAGRTNSANARPTVTLLAPAGGSVLELPGNLLLSAEAADSDGLVARVEFYDGANKLAEVAAPPYVWTLANPAAGVHPLSARAVDDRGGFQSSATALVTVLSRPPVVALTSPADGSVFVAGLSVTATATANDPDGTVALVEFLTNGVAASQSLLAPYNAALGRLPAGVYRLQAAAQDDTGRRATSAVSVIAVTGGISNVVSLVATGAAWRYWDRGSLPAANWLATNYTENSWSNGVAALGYGGGETTTVGYGPSSTSKYPTTYFRRGFLATNVSEIAALELGLVRDDGAVIYLNGSEVYRLGMPAGLVTYTNFASETVSGTAKFHWNTSSVPANLLVEGTNWFAVEMHQVNGGSSDILFDLRLNAQRVRTLPVIAEPPAPATTNAGSPASFSLRVLGTGPFSYQWRRNGTPLAGRTTTSLFIAGVTNSDAGNYDVVVTNQQGSVTSPVALLTVLPYDSDGDGMPDSWEWANGTNPFHADAGLDDDHDGLTNGQEWLTGTSPTNAASTLRLLTDSAAGVMGFAAVSNHTYTLQGSTNVAAGGWTPRWQIGGASTNRTVWFTNPPAAGPVFFRVVTPQQP